VTIELRQEPAREQADLAEPAFASWHDGDGETAATFHRLPRGYLVRFLDRADFAILPEEGLVTCWPAPDTSASYARDLYLNQIMPIILGHRGETVIHASAVKIAGRAAAFVASTGCGKSTLAAAFARAGTPFLSDDGVLLTPENGRYLASPNRPSFRLYRDSQAAVIRGEAVAEAGEDEKTRVAADETLPFQNEPVPLGAMYFLGPGDTDRPTITPLPTRQALAKLMNHSFFLDAADRERMKRHFEALGRLAETVPGYALDYPREYDRLPCVIEAVSLHMVNGRGVH